MKIKTHYAQFLDIGRPIQNQVEDIQTIKYRLEKAQQLVRSLERDLENAEADIFHDIKTVYSIDEIQEAREQLKQQNSINA